MATATKTRAAPAAVCRDLSAPLSRADAQTLASAVKAIADPARLQILSMLRAAPDRSACAGEFAGPLGLAAPTVSHHLKVLHQAGILERERRGSWVYYRLPDERLGEVCAPLL